MIVDTQQPCKSDLSSNKELLNIFDSFDNISHIYLHDIISARYPSMLNNTADIRNPVGAYLYLTFVTLI